MWQSYLRSNIFLGSQETLCSLLSPKFHCRVRNSTPLITVLNPMCPVHMSTPLITVLDSMSPVHALLSYVINALNKKRICFI
jgi:hypothetical protein